MSPKIIVKYIYGEITEKAIQHDISQVHQISERVLLNYLEENDYVLNKDDLVKILQSDGAHFHADSLRLYDNKEKSFFQVPDDFEIEIDPSQERNVELILWINSINALYKKKIDELTQGLEKTNSEVDKLSARIKEILNIQKILYDNQKKPAQSVPAPSFQNLKSIQPLEREISALVTAENLIEKAECEINVSEPLESPAAVDLKKQYSVIKYFEGDSSIESFKPRTLDIAIIYSEPLVRKVGKKYESLGDPVDYEGECTKLLEILHSKNKKIDLIFEIATHDRLVNLLAKGPVILHIICHGEYSKDRKQFHLCFEADNGELYEFYSDNLADILKSVDLKIKLVFVNACHSEEVAKVFVDGGVPCVIAIQSELKIADNVAQRFSNQFYDQIFDGKSIKESFDIAKIASKSGDTQTCCCAHSHKKDCVWYNRYARVDGFQKAHQLHMPLCSDCKKRNQHIHRSQCPWAKGFIMDFDVKDYFSNVGPNEVYTCCCSPELPHDESLKFKKICQPEVDKMVLFPQKEAGTVVNKNPYSVIEQKFPTKRNFGRNRDLFQLYDYLIKQDQKFIQLNGCEGVGKTALIKQLANYLYERGYFRDKISILMMEKTSTISQFLSDLYKEVPGSYDLKSFCESIKLSKILFILEKCDLLIENNKEDFIDCLKQISDSAKRAKFILVKHEREHLNLDEVEVMIENLAPIDAAKMLLSFAYDYLLIGDRRLDELAKRPLFTEISLTPQRVWCISERLKHRETLDDVETEYVANKEKYKLKNQGSNADFASTLQRLKSNNQPCYEFVLAIGLFPSGISSEDLREMSFLGMLPKNWHVNMKRLTLHTSQTGESFEGIDQRIVSEGWEAQTDFQLIVPGNYFWMVITKDVSKENVLHYEAASFVTRFVDKHMKFDESSFNLKKIKYLTLLSLSIINRLKAIYYYHEKLVEHSSISEYGIWYYSEDNTFYREYIKEKRSFTYVDEYKEGPKALDMTSVRKVFDAHETNFLSCIDAETVKAMIQSDGSKFGEILDVIEVAWIVIPTLYKLFAISESGARDLCLKALKMTNNLDIKDPRLSLLQAKLHLFLTSLYLHDKNEEMSLLLNVNSELEAVTKLQTEIKKSDVNTALSHYTCLTQAYLYYKIRKRHIKQKDNSDKKKHYLKKYDEILQMLKQCDDFLASLGDEYDVERCKVALFCSKIILRNVKTRNVIDIKIADRIKLAIGVFSVYNLKRLEIYANYKFALIRLNLKRAHTNKNDSNAKQMKLTDSLAQAKNHYLNRNALQIAKLINDKTFEGKIKLLIEDINTEIRQGYFNVMILMRAAPIVEVQSKLQKIESQKGDQETRAVGFPIRVVSNFKRDVTSALNEKNKKIYLKFEILNKVNLIDSLSNGCRIMQLNCGIIQNGGIVIEDSIGRLEVVPFAELQEIFNLRQTTPQLQRSGSQSNAPTFISQPTTTFSAEHYLDLLILGSKNDAIAAIFFADEIKIPHVVHFQFVEKEADFRHKIYEEHCIDKFSQFFLENIVDGLSVKESFHRARERTFDSLSYSFFESRDNDYIQKIVGEGPLLLPRDSDHDVVLYGSEDYKLSDGRVEDISHLRYPTNIGRSTLPYVGRNNDIYTIMKLLITLNFKFVKLTGDAGIGKTTFALQTSYFLLTRNFFPDGIFYFSLKNIRNQELKDMMKDTFGPKFENNMKNFFRDKKMLLVFDDFDIFYQRGIEFPRLIFLTLRECEIATLVVTSSKKKQDFMTKKKWQHEYEVKQKTIEDEFLHTERVLKPIKDEEMAHILLSLIKINKDLDVDIENIKECSGVKLAQGNPRVLIQNLLEKKIIINKKVLEINPLYRDELQLDQAITDLLLSQSHSTSPMKSSRRNSNVGSETLKVSKFHRNMSTRHSESHKTQPLPMGNRSKSYSTHALRESFGEKKDRGKHARNTFDTNLEHTLERPHEFYEEEDEDIFPEAHQNEHRTRTHTLGKLRKEKSESSMLDVQSKSSFNFAREEKAKSPKITTRSESMHYYEEQKSNDAQEILQGMMSDDDERDEIFNVELSDQNLENLLKGDSDSDDEQGRFEDEEEKGYHSHEEGLNRKNSFLEEDLLPPKNVIEKSLARPQIPRVTRKIASNEKKHRKYSALKHQTSKVKYEEDSKKPDYKELWDGELAKIPSKSKRRNYSSHVRKDLKGSEDED